MDERRVVNSSISNIYSLTPLQEGMLFHSVAENNSSNYVVQSTYHINGFFDQNKVKMALTLLSKRYDVLRTAIAYEGMEVPKQVVLKEKEIELEIIDLCAYEKDTAKEMVKSIQENDVNRGFNLQKDSPLRVKLIQLKAEEYLFIWCFHHIIMDGWCLSLIYGKFLDFYDQLQMGISEKEIMDLIDRERENGTEYGEYVKWILQKDKEQGLKYWNDFLDDYEQDTVIKNFAVREKTDCQMNKVGVTFDRPVKDKMTRLAAACNVTVNTVLEAAWGIVLQKYCRTNDVVYGKIVSGRNIDLKGIEETVGLFINTIPFRVKTEKETTIEELLTDLFQQSVRSSDYEYCALSEILNQSKMGRELIQTIFAFENYYVDNSITNNDKRDYEIEIDSAREQTNYGISVNINSEENSLTFFLMYDPQIYAETEINCILGTVETVVLEMVKGKEVIISQIDAVSKSDKNRIFGEFNKTLPEYSCERNVIQLLEQTVEQEADKMALFYQGKGLTFSEFYEKVDQLAAFLIEKGVKKGQFVALLTERSLEMIIAIYGVLKAGAAYIPISPSYAEDRISYMLEDSGAVMVLKYNAPVKTTIQSYDLTDPMIWDPYRERRTIELLPSDLAYCIYTSGTTGNPKGVMIEHNSLASLCSNIQKLLYHGYNNTNTALMADYVFDASVKMIFTSLVYGHQLHVISEDRKNSISDLVQYVNEYNIGIMDSTPTYLEVNKKELCDARQLRQIIAGGEDLKPALLKYLCDDNENLEVLNVYGPTEATVDATSYRCDKFTDEVYIGKPIDRANIFILDVNGRLCGLGMPGEICIAGAGVARGYLNQPELTKLKFTDNPFGIGKIYHSGDIGKWRLDGNIEFMGRVDEQVKVKGYRIELGEIEQTIIGYPGIRNAVAVVKEDEIHDKYICAYIVSDETINIPALREQLLRKLPVYMVPVAMMQIEAIPLTRNGKLDKKQLPEISLSVSDHDYIRPENEVQIAVAEAFCEILGMNRISITEPFFSCGGDSIKAIRVVSKVRDRGYAVTVKDIMKGQTVEAVAACAQIIIQQENRDLEVSGAIVKTPVIERFLNRKLVRPEYFNHSVMFQVNILDTVYITRALDAIYQHHDILRAVLKEDHLEILSCEKAKPYDFAMYDYNLESWSDIGVLAKEIEKRCQKVQESMNLQEGPLMKVLFFKTMKGNFMMFCLHHLIIDGVSWRILLEDFHIAVNQAVMQKTISLPAKTESFQHWASLLDEYRDSYKFKQQQLYWNKAIESMEAVALFTKWDKPYKGFSQIEIMFHETETENLLRHSLGKFNTRTDQILLAGLMAAVYNAFGSSEVVVGMEGHGREEIHKPVNVVRTIGWFTNIYPVKLQYEKNIDRLIIGVKETLNQIPNHGLEYGLLDHKLDESQVGIYFNYLGEVDEDQTTDNNYFSTGVDMSDENRINGLITINCIVENHCLLVGTVYDNNNIQQSEAELLMKEFKEAVKEMIDYCIKDSETVITASDCAETELSEQEFSQITEFMSMNMD